MISFILYVIAYLLVAVLSPVGFLYGLIVNPMGAKRKLLKMAVSLDQFGNVVMAEMFNHILGKGFGDEDETISSRLGKLKKQGKLKPIGRALAFILNTLDKNHVEKSIEDYESK